MAGVYRCSARGGPNSARFDAYVAAGRRREPIHWYNPMTSAPVLETVEALLALDAEDEVASVATSTAHRMEFFEDRVMHVTVAAPGMWTDRLATEIEHRLLAADVGGVLWWFEDPVEVEALRGVIAAETVRLVTADRQGPPSTLSGAVAQEGMARSVGGDVGRFDSDAAAALDVLGGDPSLSIMVAFLYGDEAALAMGFTPLGLAAGVGGVHAAALAAGPV